MAPSPPKLAALPSGGARPTIERPSDAYVERYRQDRARLLQRPRCWDRVSALAERVAAWAHGVLAHPLFDPVIILTILLSIVGLALDTRVRAYQLVSKPLLGKLDLWFTIIFTLELLLRFVAYGPRKALRDGWTRVDAFIVVISWFAVLMVSMPHAQFDGGALQALRAVRAFRAIRALRAVKFLTNIRRMLEALVASLPLLRDCAVLVMLLLLVYTAFGLHSFQDALDATCQVRVGGGGATPPHGGGGGAPPPPGGGGGGRPPPGGGGGAAADPEWVEQRPRRFCRPPESAVGWFAARPAVCAEPAACTPLAVDNRAFTTFDSALAAWLTVFNAASGVVVAPTLHGILEANGALSVMYFVLLVVSVTFIFFSLFIAIVRASFKQTTGKVQQSTTRQSLREQYATFAAARGLGATHGGGAAVAHPIGLEPRRPGLLTRLRQRGRRLVGDGPESAPFENLVTGIVVLNVVVMALVRADASASEAAVISRLLDAFTLIFVVEMGIKLLILGVLDYARSPWNLFDGAITVAALATLCFSLPASFTALRSMRALRLLSKLLRHDIVLATVLRSASGVVSVVVLLLVVMLVFAIIGTQLFAGEFDHLEGGARARSHFDHFFASLLTLDLVFSGGGTSTIMGHVMAVSRYIGASYFLLYFVFTKYVALNFLVVILMINFAATSQSKEDQAARKAAAVHERSQTSSEEQDPTALRELLRGGGASVDAREVMMEHLLQAESSVVLKPRAVREPTAAHPPSGPGAAGGAAGGGGQSNGARRLSVCASHGAKAPPSSASNAHANGAHAAASASAHAHAAAGHVDVSGRMRARARIDVVPRPAQSVGARSSSFMGVETGACARASSVAQHIVTDSRFEATVLFVIALSSLTLAIDAPDVLAHPLNANNRVYLATEILDTIFIAFFSVELVLRLVAALPRGLLLGKTAYLRDGWNQLDVVVLAASYASDLLGHSGGIARALRALRILRPLRAVSRYPAMRLVATALLKSFEASTRVLFLFTVLLVLFAVIGLSLFVGAFGRCNDPTVSGRAECVGVFRSGGTGVFGPRVWSSPRLTFDNFGRAFLTVFECASMKGWLPVMRAATDIVAPGQQPRADASPYNALFFVAFNFFVGFFIVKIFIGSVAAEFNKVASKGHLTPMQRRWADLLRNARALDVRGHYRSFAAREPAALWRRVAMRVSKSGAVHRASAALSGLAVVALTAEHVRDFTLDERLFAALKLLFAVAFALELAIDFSAYGVRVYVATLWGLVDALVVAALLALCATPRPARAALPFSVDGMSLPLATLRLVMRVQMGARALQLRGVHMLLGAMRLSLPLIVNILSLQLLLTYMYAALGLQLFGDVRLGEHLDGHANFRSIFKGLLLLFEVAAGEDWIAMMVDASVAPPLCTPAADAPPGRHSDCGSPIAAFLFFTSHWVLVINVLLNLYVATILDAFTVVLERRRWPISLARFGLFLEAWVATHSHSAAVVRAAPRARRPATDEMPMYELPHVLRALAERERAYTGGPARGPEDLDFGPADLTPVGARRALSHGVVWDRIELLELRYMLLALNAVESPAGRQAARVALKKMHIGDLSDASELSGRSRREGEAQALSARAPSPRAGGSPAAASSTLLGSVHDATNRAPLRAQHLLYLLCKRHAHNHALLPEEFVQWEAHRARALAWAAAAVVQANFQGFRLRRRMAESAQRKPPRTLMRALTLRGPHSPKNGKPARAGANAARADHRQLH